jgi:hypothetical protein
VVHQGYEPQHLHDTTTENMSLSSLRAIGRSCGRHGDSWRTGCEGGHIALHG